MPREGEREMQNQFPLVSITPLIILLFFSLEINGTQICPISLVSFHEPSDLENVPRLRYLRLDGNQLKPPIPLDLMMCFRLLQSVIF